METQREPTNAGEPAGGGGEVLEPDARPAPAPAPATAAPPAPATATATASPAAPPASATDRDAVLAKVEMERKLSMVKAWEENQKSKADNRAEHKMSSILSWENTKKAAVEAKLRTREEKLEKKKAEYAEKMRNRVAMIHKEAEEQRAAVEAMRQEEMIKCQEMAAKHRSKGTTPKKKFLTCFG
ncbi:remorin 1.4-like isoform X1 [Hordeum vulgare subsp. vulgare]|uniref:remorin 1.4-like isoform X1 n=1 Tax=Hordeum vulgare subsp. vulgare TaxID=112509 RepID=UPI00029630E5|nr:remorin 1.4-like isoform X1 [Hordeum vulgare subsp. vulgare]